MYFFIPNETLFRLVVWNNRSKRPFAAPYLCLLTIVRCEEPSLFCPRLNILQLIDQAFNFVQIIDHLLLRLLLSYTNSVFIIFHLF